MYFWYNIAYRNYFCSSYGFSLSFHPSLDLSIHYLVKVKQVAEEASSPSMTSITIIIIIVIVIISVSVVSPIMFFVNPVLSHCYLVYFSSIQPHTLARRTVVDICIVSPNLLHRGRAIWTTYTTSMSSHVIRCQIFLSPIYLPVLTIKAHERAQFLILPAQVLLYRSKRPTHQNTKSYWIIHLYILGSHCSFNVVRIFNCT